ncbi:MAG: hypothetical protein IKP88_02740 [Lachnospiraceae bacterium]|nr:hypothetical protein [Lachnospiraceae bacterium]
MKIELTQRDKKLLTFMGVFVIVVLIGYYGIIPQIKKASEYQDEIEEQEAIQSVNDTKIGQLFMVESNNNDLEKLIEGAKENYYPMMDSDEIDNLVTNTVIDKYGLMSFDLTIGERTLADLSPYVYSKKALTGESDAKERALKAAAPEISEDGMLLFADLEDAESDIDSVETVGIYMVPVTMRLSGDMNNINKLLDDLALTEKKLRLVNCSVSTEETIIPHEDGTEEVFSTDQLNIMFELYMCED